MKKILIIIFLFLFINALKANSSSEIAKIKVHQIGKVNFVPYRNIYSDTLIDIQYEGNPNVFPVFESSNRPDVAEKINLILQIKHLSQIPNKYIKQDPFFISSNNGKYGTKYFNGYKVEFLTKSIIQVNIGFEQSYCTGVMFSDEYTLHLFSLITGDQILFKDFFSESGLESIKTKTINSFHNQFDKIIEEINSEMGDSIENNSNKERLKEQLEFYKDCKFYSTSEYFLDNIFSYKKDGIYITRRRCWGNETGRSLDEFSTPSYFISFKDITSELSDFGKFILGFSNEISMGSNFENKTFKGMIDEKYPIKAIIYKIDDRSIRMCYWSDKVGKPIEFIGTNTDNEIDLRSEDDNEEIKAKIADNKIIGTWRNISTNNVWLKFELEKY
jgi:hypothetical protein